jgi:hypothetical protein
MFRRAKLFLLELINQVRVQLRLSTGMSCCNAGQPGSDFFEMSLQSSNVAASTLRRTSTLAASFVRAEIKLQSDFGCWISESVCMFFVIGVFLH